MKVLLTKDCPQGSEKWWEAKWAVPSASNFDRIVTGRGKLSKQARGYIAELVGQMAYGGYNPNYFTEQGRPVNTYAMRNGQDTEPQARRWVELETGAGRPDGLPPLTEVGFCLDDDFRFGCSPDGIFGLEHGAEPEGEWQGIPYYAATAAGGLELKCPLLKTHVKYLMEGVLPREYVPQVHGQLIVCGLPWVEFCSYAEGQLAPFRLRVTPNEFTDTLRTALGEFWEQYETAREKFLGHQQGAMT